MNMKKKYIPFIAIFCIGALLICALIFNGVIVFDHSAQRRGEKVFWNNALYVPCSGSYSEGKTIAKTADGTRINEVKQDDSHTFIVERSFLDDHLLVREDYQIPTSGEVTTAYWQEEITDETFLKALSEILEQAVTDFTYETDNIYGHTDKQRMKALYVGYNGCPVAVFDAGCLGTFEGKRYITTEKTNHMNSNERYQVSYYTIITNARAFGAV